MRINSTHDFGSRGLDAYFTCPEAIRSLILLEGSRLPQRIWEPAAGDGAIVRELVASGRFVVASDIHDYGLECCRILDYLTAPRMIGVDGVVPIRLTKRRWPSPRRRSRRIPLCRAAGPDEL